jgi:pimeloyl-ACP methyl ester carboxylesterase
VRILLAPGGPGLDERTLADLPLPCGIETVPTAIGRSGGRDPILLHTDQILRRLDDEPRRSILLGHSMGARASILATSMRPQKVAGLVLFGAELEDGIDNPELLFKRVQSLDGRWRDAARRALQTQPTALPQDDAELLELVVANLALGFPQITPAHERFLHACEQSWRLDALRAILAGSALLRRDLAPLLLDMEIPLLVVNGAEDPWAGERSARRFERAMPRSRVVLLPGSGHAPWLDEAEVVRHLLAEFFSEVGEA